MLITTLSLLRCGLPLPLRYSTHLELVLGPLWPWEVITSSTTMCLSECIPCLFLSELLCVSLLVKNLWFIVPVNSLFVITFYGEGTVFTYL